MSEPSKQNKPWYKKWWGVILAIWIWPFFLVWFTWAKSKKNVLVKVLATSGIAALAIISMTVVASGSHQSTPTTASITKTNSVPTSNKPSVAPSTTSKASSTPSPSKNTVPAQPPLVGYGALLSDWNAHHQADTRYAANSVYNPDPSLGSDNEHDAKYYMVNVQNDRVLNYSMRLPNNSNQAAAQAEVMQEFPSDASVLWQKAQTSDSTSACYQIEIKSATLGTALATPAIGDASGEVFVEFSTYTPSTSSSNSVYDASNVNGALLQLGSYPAATDAPGC